MCEMKYKKNWDNSISENGLPLTPYDVVVILNHKDRMIELLKEKTMKYPVEQEELCEQVQKLWTEIFVLREDNKMMQEEMTKLHTEIKMLRNKLHRD